MADLQDAVADDDAFDHKLQDRLLVGEEGRLQPASCAIAERPQTGADGLGLQAFAA